MICLVPIRLPTTGRENRSDSSDSAAAFRHPLENNVANKLQTPLGSLPRGGGSLVRERMRRNDACCSLEYKYSLIIILLGKRCHGKISSLICLRSLCPPPLNQPISLCSLFSPGASISSLNSILV